MFKTSAGKLLSFLLCLTVASQHSYAQLQVFPARESQRSVERISHQARTKATEPLKLPFWDDFSTRHNARPDTTKWINSNTVSVNDGLAVNQPSINVATFDGINDSTGIAYNPNQVLVTGFGDKLISRPIDLSETAVTLAERPGVYLSFQYQWQGNGEAPDSDDYLQLEFKNSDNLWEVASTIFPEEGADRTKFYSEILRLDSADYFHKMFQFRFRSFGRQSGPFDSWNVDYVYLDKNRDAADTVFFDRAIASETGGLFGSYSSVPYRHFKKNPAVDIVEFDVQNNSDRAVVVEYYVLGEYTNMLPDSTLKPLVADTLVKRIGIGRNESGQPTGLMQPFQRVKSRYNNGPDVNNTSIFDPFAISVDLNLKTVIVSGDSIVDQNGLVDFRVNDTINSLYKLSNYYAYDDSVAEYAAGLIEPGNRIAYQFDMVSYPDTLIGFYIYFPPYALTDNQTVSYTIYRDNNGQPGEAYTEIPARTVRRLGVNEFQYVQFIPAVLIDEPRFYVGWRQPPSGRALVGLDLDNDTSEKMFINTNGSWYQNQAVNGSLMLRPVFGKGDIDDTNTGVIEDLGLSVFPNPSQGSFFIQGQFDDIKIFSVTGSGVPFSLMPGSQQTQIQLSQATPGIYVIQLVKGGRIATHKISVFQ